MGIMTGGVVFIHFGVSRQPCQLMMFTYHSIYINTNYREYGKHWAPQGLEKPQKLGNFLFPFWFFLLFLCTFSLIFSDLQLKQL